MDKTAKSVKTSKGAQYCDKPGTSCMYDVDNFCVNCGRPKGWRSNRTRRLKFNPTRRDEIEQVLMGKYKRNNTRLNEKFKNGWYTAVANVMESLGYSEARAIAYVDNKGYSGDLISITEVRSCPDCHLCTEHQ